MNKKILAIAVGALLGVCIILTAIGIKNQREAAHPTTAEPLTICLTDGAPTPHMNGVVDRAEARWRGLVKIELAGHADCAAQVRYSDKESPAAGDGYTPGVAKRDCPSCMPYVVLYKDAWVGGHAGAGQFVLDHEIGHLLCLTHWPEGSTAVMRPSIWGGDPSGVDGEGPKPAMITTDMVAKAWGHRAADCVGPLAPSVR